MLLCALLVWASQHAEPLGHMCDLSLPIQIDSAVHHLDISGRVLPPIVATQVRDHRVLRRNYEQRRFDRVQEFCARHLSRTDCMALKGMVTHARQELEATNPECQIGECQLSTAEVWNCRRDCWIESDGFDRLQSMVPTAHQER
jgi:hypothetical protein